MPFERPTLKQLFERISHDFSGRLLDGGKVLSRSVLAVFSKVLAGACNGMYGMLSWTFLQVFPDTAESVYLERWATIWGIIRKHATKAVGNVLFIGEPSSFIPAGTILLHQPSGQQYSVQYEVTVPSAGQVLLLVKALVEGSSGNQPAETALSFTAPIKGIQSQGIVDASGITGGVDEEDDESLRSRLLLLLRQPPRGGAAHDYIAWALEVPGVTRAWCYPMALGIGTVALTFVCDNQVGSPIPDEETVRRVQEYIDIKRPVTVKEFQAYAPEIFPITVSLSVTPNTVAVRDAVEAELGDMMAREAKPDTTLLLSHFNQAISLATGETDHSLFFPKHDINVPQGSYPILHSVEFLGG